MQFGLLLGAGAQFERDVLAGLAIGGQRLLKARQPLADRAGDLLQGVDQTRHRGHERGIALDARPHPLQALCPLGPLALRALEHPALGGELGRQLGAAPRLRPVVRCGAAALDECADAALLLAQLVERAHGGAMGVGEPVARRVCVGHRGGDALHPSPRIQLGLGRAL